jgi:hypothetical protein
MSAQHSLSSVGQHSYLGQYDSPTNFDMMSAAVCIVAHGVSGLQAKASLMLNSHLYALTLCLLAISSVCCSDGTTSVGYYTGANGWAPLMGVGESVNYLRSTCSFSHTLSCRQGRQLLPHKHLLINYGLQQTCSCVCVLAQKMHVRCTACEADRPKVCASVNTALVISSTSAKHTTTGVMFKRAPCSCIVLLSAGYYQPLSQWSKGEYANANEVSSPAMQSLLASKLLL